MQQVLAAVRDSSTQAQDVAEAVWRALTDPAALMSLPAGAVAVALTAAG